MARTAAGARYMEDGIHMFNFLDFVTRTASNLGKTTRAHKTLLEDLSALLRVGSTVASDVKEHAIELDSLLTLAMQWHTYEPFLANTMFCKVMDTFQIYLGDLLALIFAAKPEMLKSDEKMKVSAVFEYDSLASLQFGPPCSAGRFVKRSVRTV